MTSCSKRKFTQPSIEGVEGSFILDGMFFPARSELAKHKKIKKSRTADAKPIHNRQRSLVLRIFGFREMQKRSDIYYLKMVYDSISASVLS